MNKEFPWLDEEGQPLSDEKLKEVSKSWNPETWEQYLKSLEVSCKELLPANQKLFQSKAEKIQISTLFHELTTEESRKRFKALLQDAISTLTDKQKFVILGIYYFNASMQELANEYRVGKSSIQKLHDRAILRLRKYLKNPALYNCSFVPRSVPRVQGGYELPLNEGIKKLVLKLEGGNSESKQSTAS